MSTNDQIEVDNHPAEGRGGKILALGIVSLLFLGPLSGIPAWIMGHRDLKRISLGKINDSNRTLTQVGKIFGIVGTFISPIFLICSSIIIAVVLSVLDARNIQLNKDAIMTDVTNLAIAAKEYRRRPSGAGGGGGYYKGFELSEQMKHTTNGTYMIRVLSSDSLQIVGSFVRNYDDGVIAYIGKEGSILRWAFSGSFDPFPRFPFRYKSPQKEKSPEDETKIL